VLRTRQKDVAVLMQSHDQHVCVRGLRSTGESDAKLSATKAGDVTQSHEPLPRPVEAQCTGSSGSEELFWSPDGHRDQIV